jgi:hypothetical protein
MAVTIIQNAQKYTPSDNPIIFTWFSSQFGQTNFSYIVDVYINGTLDSRQQIFTERGGGYAHFDCSEIVRTYVSTPILGGSSIVNDADISVEVYLIIREFYGATPALQANATTNTINAFKSSLSNVEFDSFDYTDFKSTANTKRFLTDSPNDLYIREGQDYYLTIITDEDDEAGLDIIWYDENDVVIASADYTDFVGRKITQWNLNSDNYLSFLTQPVLDTVSYLELVVINSNTSAELSETKRLYLDRGCDYGAELIWLNKYGGFDVFNYSHNLIRSSDVNGKQYEKQYGGWVDVTYTLDSTNSGMHSYFKTANDKVTLVSSYINSDTQNWLVNSAYISPLVYFFDSIRQLCSINGTAYSESQDRFVEETTEIVELALPNMRKSVIV